MSIIIGHDHVTCTRRDLRAGWFACLQFPPIRSQALYQPYTSAEPPLRGTATSIKCRSTTTPICVPNRDSLFVLMFCPRVYYYILPNHPALFPMDGTCLLASLPFPSSLHPGEEVLSVYVSPVVPRWYSCTSAVPISATSPMLGRWTWWRSSESVSQSVRHSLWICLSCLKHLIVMRWSPLPHVSYKV